MYTINKEWVYICALQEKRFCFLELATVQEASNVLAFDGILFKGEALKIRRPRDYNPAVSFIFAANLWVDV